MLSLTLGPGAALRLPEEADAPEMAALVDANRDRLARWMPWAAANTEADTREFIKLARRQLADNDGLQTVIVVAGRIVGIAGVHGINRMRRTTSLGYWLDAAFEGRGLVTAAVRAYTREAFDAWGCHRIVLEAAVENARSRAVAERCGYTLEGIARRSWWVGDTVQDMAVYAALAGEWTP